LYRYKCVTDLSRLGRNYIEVGQLMEDVFPRYNVRLISINDNYDSLNPRTETDEIVLPFKNLINEQYLRDASVKIRSGLNIKRKNGAFVAAFAPYGYRRDENDRHRLAIDEHAAEIVRDIFNRKIEGKSPQKIADRLNGAGEPSPAEYKKRGSNYTAQFQTRARALWSAVAVGRILRNPVYTGVLIQGKQTTPNYKVKRRIYKPADEWFIAEGAHESVVSKNTFDIANGLLDADTRAPPNRETVYPLSGLIFCGDCGGSMIRTKSGAKVYYVCAAGRVKENPCTSHCIRHEQLERTVTEALTRRIAVALDIEKSLENVRPLPGRRRDAFKLTAQITDREQEIGLCQSYKRSLYEDYKSGILSEEDYTGFGKDYTARIEELRQAVISLQKEAELLLDGGSPAYDWLLRFTRHKTLPDFTRQLTAHLIERIEVFTGKRMKRGVHNGKSKQKAAAARRCTQWQLRLRDESL
jgi:hypothetical protein